MASAGLPGTGVGGLFYVLLALWMPVRELWATARGRGDRARWRAALVQSALAWGVVGAVAATVLTYRWLADSWSWWPSTAWALLPVALLLGLAAGVRLWARVVT